ncbi:MAG: methyltransferase domain-containing protein [Pseudomonadota bacterium]
MHASSLENMQRCYDEYLARSPLLRQPKLTVVDIGGAHVNGSYADIFAAPKFNYVAVDVEAGDGVDVVLEDPNILPFEDRSADVVLSGQCFEHAEFFWVSFAEMARVVKDQGLIFLIVPSAGPIHRYPVDCYRFYPDAMAALAKYADIPLIACWHDNRGPWNDLVAVFCRDFQPDDGVGHLLPWNRYPLPPPTPVADRPPKTPEMEIAKGAEPYLETLSHIHETLAPRGYVEIGVNKGDSLALAACPGVAVEPKPQPGLDMKPTQTLFEMTSDRFFAHEADRALDGFALDLAFIDGMHLFEFALRDFIAIEARAHSSSVVIVDDIFPNHPRQADRVRTTNFWTGDVWKLHAVLKKWRPDLILIPIDTRPSGLLLIAGLDPENQTLISQYNPIVTNFRERPLPPAVLRRPAAVPPRDTRVTQLLAHLATARAYGPSERNALAPLLRALAQGIAQDG